MIPPDRPLNLRVIVAAHRVALRTLRVLHHGVNAATLALLSDASLDGLTASFYARASCYHDERYNLSGLAAWEALVLARHIPSEGTVLVTSAGGGREALALVASGRRVLATECVPDLVAVLRAHLADAVAAGAARVQATAPDAVPLDQAPYAAAIVGWTAYGHLPGRARRIAFLERLRAALQPRAPLLVSFWGSLQPHGRGARLAAAVANIVRRPLARPPAEPGDSTERGFFMHRFGPDEVAAEARAAGLEVLAEDWDGCPHLVARAPAAASR